MLSESDDHLLALTLANPDNQNLGSLLCLDTPITSRLTDFVTSSTESIVSAVKSIEPGVLSSRQAQPSAHRQESLFVPPKAVDGKKDQSVTGVSKTCGSR